MLPGFGTVGWVTGRASGLKKYGVLIVTPPLVKEQSYAS